MGNYYFLTASLPALTLRKRPDLTTLRLKTLLQENLSAADYELVEIYYRLLDLHNIRVLAMNGHIDPRGNLSEKELDEALLTQQGLPEYVFDYLELHKVGNERSENFAQLLAAYFEHEIPRAEGLLKDLLEFDRAYRIVLTGLRCKELKLDLAKQLQFEDSSDYIVAQLLAQKDAARYDPPIEFTELAEVFRNCKHDTWLRHEELLKYRYKKIEELATQPLFSLDWIIAFSARLMIVEDLFYFDSESAIQKGNKLLETYTSR